MKAFKSFSPEVTGISILVVCLIKIMHVENWIVPPCWTIQEKYICGPCLFRVYTGWKTAQRNSLLLNNQAHLYGFFCGKNVATLPHNRGHALPLSLRGVLFAYTTTSWGPLSQGGDILEKTHKTLEKKTAKRKRIYYHGLSNIFYLAFL